jgi:hypothetical protein
MSDNCRALTLFTRKAEPTEQTWHSPCESIILPDVPITWVDNDTIWIIVPYNKL